MHAPLEALLGLKLQSESKTLALMLETSQNIERSWKKRENPTNAPRKKRANESSDVSTQGQRRTPFGDLTNQEFSNLRQHQGMQELRQRNTRSVPESQRLKNELATKDQELSLLRGSLEAMTLQLSRQSHELDTTRRRSKFTHRLCSISMLTMELGAEVLVESFGFGRVSNSTFQYNNASVYWSLVTSVDSVLVIDFEGIGGQSIEVKLGHDFAIWVKEATVRQEQLQNLYQGEPFSIEQRNGFVCCLLNESKGDSNQCNAIIGAYHEDQAKRAKEEARVTKKELRTANMRADRLEDRASFEEKQNAEFRIATFELGTGEDSKRLTALSDWINAICDKRVLRIYIGLTVYGEPLLTSTIIDEEIIPRWRNDFPITSREMFDSICSPSHKLSNPSAITAKWRKAFVNFFMQRRQRNPCFGISLAKVIGLALYKWGIRKEVHRLISFLGLSCHPSTLSVYIQDLTNSAPHTNPLSYPVV